MTVGAYFVSLLFLYEAWRGSCLAQQANRAFKINEPCVIPVNYSPVSARPEQRPGERRNMSDMAVLRDTSAGIA